MNAVISEVTGTVWKVVTPAGTRVAEGDTIFIVESMKMEIPVCSPCDGTVAELHIGEGEAVVDGQTVATVAP